MPKFIASYVRLFIISLAIFSIQASHADNLRTLLMPGPLIKAHAKYEENCDQCHDTNDKKLQGPLCVKCHDHQNILDDINTKKGFHGKLPAASKDNCKHCHSDHKGRDANIVQFNTSTFDHTKTDFKLKGKHTKTACTACHKPEKKYSEAELQCYSCHKKDDVHDGKQGKKCADCHAETGWEKTAFDHDKTDFPLKGAHNKTSCDSCHINQEYKDTPDTCIGCHKIQDVHKGGYGTKCKDCHASTKWKEAKFDHTKKTDFPLHGAHKKTSCNSCHTTGNLEKEVPSDCYGCHKNDDSHKGRNGKKCDDCHNNNNWSKSKFDHSKTDFPLRGKHSDVVCTDCHKESIEKELNTDCIECHKKDDIHKGQQGKQCANCHNEKGWKNNLSFDHDLSNFPLIGMHVTVACDECHLTSEYSATSMECNGCHSPDDVHETRLGTNCQACHNPNSWVNWIFDHDKATNFKIDGAHKDLGCYDCHATRSKEKLNASGDCISCHRSDDIHNRKFGRHCNECHHTENFKDVNIKR